MLSKTSKQVVNALVEMARLSEGEYIGVGIISQKIAAPQNYLGKVLQMLSSTGIVVSQKGMGGGFRLGKPSKEISLFDVVEPLENVTAWSVCALGNDKCSDKSPCPIHFQWKSIKEQYLSFLKKTTVADLVK